MTTEYIATTVTAYDGSYEPTDDIVIGSYSTLELAKKAVRNNMEFHYRIINEEDDESVAELLEQEMVCENGTYSIFDEGINQIWMIIETVKDYIPTYEY